MYDLHLHSDSMILPNNTSSWKKITLYIYKFHFKHMKREIFLHE